MKDPELISTFCATCEYNNNGICRLSHSCPKELAILKRMTELMARRVNYNANHNAERARNIIKEFRAQAEREIKDKK